MHILCIRVYRIDKLRSEKKMLLNVNFLLLILKTFLNFDFSKNVSFLFLFFFVFLRLHPRHMEVPKLVVKLELSPLVYSQGNARSELHL